MKKFSIITCVWNSEPYIEQCIQSVQSQLHSDIEHLFVDGGSTDGTLERIQQLPGNVRYVTGVRGGIAHAMNVGAQLAEGEFIAHLHGDDWYLHPNVIGHVEAALSVSAADWLYGRAVDDMGGILSYPSWKVPEFSFKNILSKNFISHPTVFIRRSIFEKVGGFNEEYKYAMDYDLWLRLAKSSQPTYLAEYLTAFRRHAGSASTANPVATFKEDLAIRLNHARGTSFSPWMFKAIHNWRSCKRWANAKWP